MKMGFFNKINNNTIVDTLKTQSDRQTDRQTDHKHAAYVAMDHIYT